MALGGAAGARLCDKMQKLNFGAETPRTAVVAFAKRHGRQEGKKHPKKRLRVQRWRPKPSCDLRGFRPPPPPPGMDALTTDLDEIAKLGRFDVTEGGFYVSLKDVLDEACSDPKRPFDLDQILDAGPTFTNQLGLQRCKSLEKNFHRGIIQNSDWDALIEVEGKKQFFVKERQHIWFNNLIAKSYMKGATNPGSKIMFFNVLAIKRGDGDYVFGDPYVADACVEAEVIENYREEQHIVHIKHVSKKNYRRYMDIVPKTTHVKFIKVMTGEGTEASGMHFKDGNVTVRGIPAQGPDSIFDGPDKFKQKWQKHRCVDAKKEVREVGDAAKFAAQSYEKTRKNMNLTLDPEPEILYSNE